MQVFVYEDNNWEQTLDLVDTTTQYGLTGSMYGCISVMLFPYQPHMFFSHSFATDRKALIQATNRLRNAAGNVYYNEKCTGAVVGQQPFGGARASGTNDKAGSMAIFYRFVSARSIKEKFVGLEDYVYPSNLE